MIESVSYPDHQVVSTVPLRRPPSTVLPESVPPPSSSSGPAYAVSISETGRALYETPPAAAPDLPGAARPVAGAARSEAMGPTDGRGAEAAETEAPAEETAPPPTEDPAQSELTAEEVKEVQDLEQRDNEVRAHEQAHKRAAGSYAGPPSYSFTTGPDHQRYATDGEVSIDLSPVPNDPQATVWKMQTIKRAAMAPAQPSGQDRVVYNQAAQYELEAKAQIQTEAQETARPTAEEGEGADAERVGSTAQAGGYSPQANRSRFNVDESDRVISPAGIDPGPMSPMDKTGASPAVGPSKFSA